MYGSTPIISGSHVIVTIMVLDVFSALSVEYVCSYKLVINVLYLFRKYFHYAWTFLIYSPLLENQKERTKPTLFTT